jgi:hypothetical protein
MEKCVIIEHDWLPNGFHDFTTQPQNAQLGNSDGLDFEKFEANPDNSSPTSIYPWRWNG